MCLSLPLAACSTWVNSFSNPEISGYLVSMMSSRKWTNVDWPSIDLVELSYNVRKGYGVVLETLSQKPASDQSSTHYRSFFSQFSPQHWKAIRGAYALPLMSCLQCEEIVRRPSHGNLKLANPSWCVWTAQKQAANTFANCWRQIETCLPTVFMPFTRTKLSLPKRVCQL